MFGAQVIDHQARQRAGNHRRQQTSIQGRDPQQQAGVDREIGGETDRLHGQIEAEFPDQGALRRAGRGFRNFDRFIGFFRGVVEMGQQATERVAR